jgi:hypothetical protein
MLLKTLFVNFFIKNLIYGCKINVSNKHCTMSDLNLKYSSPQDQLLIMLLERITALEDVINKQTATLSELVSMSKSDVFTVYMTGKYIKTHIVGGGLEDITKVEDQIISVINNIVPCHSIYAHFNYDNTGGLLMMHTQERYLLRTIQTFLNQKLTTLVNLNSWEMKCPMDILKHTESMQNYRILGKKPITLDID